MSSISKKFNNKNIALLGFGSENLEMARFFVKHKVNCNITICDQNKDIKEKYPEFDRENFFWQLGSDYDKKLASFDYVFRIAGYPLFYPEINKAQQAGVTITSPTKLFFEFCPSKNIIGVTGTKGKGTTSALIVEILNSAGKKAFFGGNIGIPMFSFIDEIKKDDWVVLELSSFQLEDIDASPHIVVLTNLYRDHLQAADPVNPNYHKSYQEYIEAKLNIFKYQKRNDFAIINKKIDFAGGRTKRGNANLGKAKKIYFTCLDYPSRLVGEHNKENIAAAAEVARIAGVKEAVIKKTVKKFKGLEHRIEYSGEVGGVNYYDDSFATMPESAIIALKSFDAPIILLAGGSDKGANFSKLARIIKEKVKIVVLFDGEASLRIKKELLRIDYPNKNIYLARSMKEAFSLFRKETETGDIVLLSPACASFGLFKNYKERGNLFKKEVKLNK
jgi:UDP-N-acetylmuramoylalanine--D-glutamate ligase